VDTQATAVQTAVVESAVGPLSVAADDTVVRRVSFGAEGAVADAAPGSLAARAAAQLAEYFAGTRRGFDVEPDWPRVDDESARVLATLVRIAPFGHTVSYGELAAAADLYDDPRLGQVASRVVGQVLHANPWPVLVPCHRVVMADGSLGGFGGGVWRKEALLRLEGVLPATLFD
jgi:methylated-DNA-[protein]-cysteine S-methyltransferase